MKKLKRFASKIGLGISGLALLGTLLSPISISYAEDTRNKLKKQVVQSVQKQSDYKFSPRININFRNPKKDSEANTKLTHSLMNLLGESTEYVGRKIEGSTDSFYSKMICRGAEAGLNTLSAIMLNIISHEYGHYRVGEKKGAKGGKVHIGLWLLKRSWYSYENPGNLSLDDKLEITEGGPNQDSLNTLESFKNSQIEGNKLYNSTYRLINNLAQNYYIWKSKEGMDDYKNIERRLNRKGYNISLKNIRKNNTLLNSLNPTNWSDLYNLLKFFKEGKRDSESIKIGKGSLKFGLPNLSHFFILDGELVTLTEIMWLKETALEFSFSHDLDFTQKNAGLNTIRAGGKIHRINLNNVELSPYLYLNFKRNNLNYSGLNMGTEFGVDITKNFSLTGKIEYNKDDILESGIRGKGNGIYTVIGIKKEF